MLHHRLNLKVSVLLCQPLHIKAKTEAIHTQLALFILEFGRLQLERKKAPVERSLDEPRRQTNPLQKEGFTETT